VVGGGAAVAVAMKSDCAQKSLPSANQCVERPAYGFEFGDSEFASASATENAVFFRF
jgi:hypothetical protein